MIRIRAIGGYGEIGRNMTLLTVDDESLVLDMGIHLERLVEYTEDEDLGKLKTSELIKHEVIPNDEAIDKKKIVGIVPSHGHLDHIAAIPYLEKNYDCPIYCTPYTAEVLKRQFDDNKFKRKNKIISCAVNSKVNIGSFVVEFVHMTHSIPHTAMLFVHTKYGTVVYANDFKIDLHPTLCDTPNLKYIESISSNVKVLITECLRAQSLSRTPSESVAVQMLEDIFSGIDHKRNTIFFTSFSSQIERLHVAIHLARKYNRKILLFGRSLEKYLTCAKTVGVSDCIDDVEVVPYRALVKRRMKQLQRENMSEYMIVMTGHQGEKQAVLASMVNGKLPNIFRKGDLFIFSCNTIPSPKIISARQDIEEKLEQKGLRLFTDVHASGHASREDLRDLISHIKPQHIIPAHGTMQMMQSFADFAEQEGYERKKTIHFLKVGDEFVLKD